MQSKTKLLGLAAVCALVAAVACSGTPNTPVSPSGTAATDPALNPDGSSLKITAPVPRSPIDNQTVSSIRPRLEFANAVGRHVQLGFYYEIEIYEENGRLAYSNNAGETPSQSGHDVQSNLSYSTNYWWRVRGRLEGSSDTGPWSVGLATFRTPDPPPPPTPPTTQPPVGGGLPFPVPAACGPFGPNGGFGCALAIAAQSAEWAGCAAGFGTRCHRFTRQVAYALALSDPNWNLIMAAPGGHACTCNSCGPSDGTMFREDTVVYGGNRVFDMILGAGGPSPSLAWQEVPGPRAGDIPAKAPLCNP